MAQPNRLFLCLGLIAMMLNVTGAQSTSKPGLGFGTIGIAAGQTARVKALNLGSGSLEATTSSCSVTLQFLNAEGQVIKQKVVTLGVGKAAWLDLKSDELIETVDLRTEVRASLLFGYFGGANPPRMIFQKYDCNIVPGLELYDTSTGRTIFVLTDAKQLPITPQQ